MKIMSQIAVILGIVAVAVPVSARFVPGTRPWLDGAGLLSPLVAAGIVPAETEGGPGEPGQGGGSGRGTAVIALPVETQPLRDTVSSIGSARGIQAVTLSFERSGRLGAILVAPGERVEAGQVIAELDAETARLALERAQLVLADRQKTVDRLGQLVGSGATTALQRQDAELALRTAELELKTAERDLADHRLTAPIAGYVGLIEAQVGDLVTPTTAMTRIEDRSSLLLDFRVPERIAALVKPGDTIRATAVSAAGQPIEGRITAVDNRVDDASRTLRVQAAIDNPDDQLRAGMAFRIDLDFTGASYPAVDPLAIQWGAEGPFVWIVRDTKADRVPIRILQRNAGSVLVEASFQPGDLVVTEGVQNLRPGAEVSVAPPRS